MNNKPTRKKSIIESTWPKSLIPHITDMTDIDSVIQELQSFRDRGYTKIQILYESCIDYENDYSSHCSVRVYREREETDEEFEARVAKWQQDLRNLREANKKRKEEREAGS